MILLLLAGLLCSCQFNSNTRGDTHAKTRASESYNTDSIINIEISESNKKFSINDSLAVVLIQQVKEIKQIIDYKYEDTTIFNQINIDNVPTDSDNNWHIKIVQFQPKTEHAASIMWLLVNANNGKISILDIEKDTYISLEDWLKMRTRI
jgi:anionic cell wall polymer biosynthesis LytR-Cps2A-Psr (LCP) family protein